MRFGAKNIKVAVRMRGTVKHGGGSMKIVSWNVNGLRASLKNSGTDLKVFLDRLDADVICFQETKAQSQSLYQNLGKN